MCIESIVCSSDSEFVKLMIRNFFVDVSVFQFSIEINCLISLLDMRLVRDRVLVMKYSYEYNEDFVLTVNNRINWFFRFDVLETNYDEKILHKECQDRIWPIYSFWLSIVVCTQDSFTKSTDSNQFSEIFFQKASAVVLVRECYSYEVDVKNLS